MLRIANVCTSRAWGGLEMSALEWAQVLGQRGHEVHTIVVQGSRLSQEARERGLAVVDIGAVYRDPGELACFPTQSRPAPAYTMTGWVEATVKANAGE